MRLLIISNMSHYRHNGRIVGWGPTVQEIDHLSQLFDEVRHIGCFHDEPAPASALPYQSERVTLIPIAPAGGDRIPDKLHVVRSIPQYLRMILRELPQADIVHVRCPANVSMIAVLLLSFLRMPALRWVKYAGNWHPDGKEARSYTLQRWWLRRGLHRGIVTVNGRWPDQADHVYSFLNPSLTDEELERARGIASDKQLSTPIRLLYVGRLETAKGVGRALEILALLKQRGVAATLDLAGDGTERPEFEQQALHLGIRSLVTFHGWLPRPDLSPLFARAHVLLFPSSSSEGWPKVLSEGMAYGAVPVAGAVSSIPQILAETGCGVAVPPHDCEAFADAIEDFALHPDRWKDASMAGARSASKFTYRAYLQSVREIIHDAWSISLPQRAQGAIPHQVETRA